MKKYHMELTKDDADLIVAAVNQGIDAHLQAVTDSTFEVVNPPKGSIESRVGGGRLVCDVAPNDMRVILRRLLETEREREESLALCITSTLGIEEMWLCTDDSFYITIDEYIEEFEMLAAALDLPYISIFDDSFWPYLFNEVL